VNSTSNGYTVQVLDAAGVPVAGAAVAVRLPDDGPSGTFADGNKASVAYSDSKGQVRFQQIHWNGSPGIAVVRVTVVKGAAHAGVLIQQSLIVNPNGSALTSAKTPATTVVAPFGAPGPDTPPPPVNRTVATAPPPPVPGTPVSPATPVSHSGATSAALQSPSQSASAASPSVSVTDTSSTGGGSAHGGVSKKWILLAVVAAGAGVGAALAMSGHGSTAVAAAPGLTIGSPTLSVGH
jgi:hypothetical protein